MSSDGKLENVSLYLQTDQTKIFNFIYYYCRFNYNNHITDDLFLLCVLTSEIAKILTQDS